MSQQTFTQLKTNSKILCGAISTSTTYIATGHDNASINLFRVVYNDKAGETNFNENDNEYISHELKHLMELKGHKYGVTALNISPSENFIMTGSDAGSIKYFDLKTEKVVRTMTPGHRSMVTCFSFIPKFENKQYASSSTSNLFASGSLDTNVKIWDLRIKKEVFTLKGHNLGVRCCKFTPDSMWVVSGSESGTIKIFDIAAGKDLYTFEDAHSKTVNDIDFHPEEYLMATGSSDKTVKLWDLDSKQLVNATPITSTKIQKIQFLDPRIIKKKLPITLLASSKDNLKVWQFEPCLNLDQMDVSWPLLTDTKVNADTSEIYSCSSYGTTLALQTIPLSQLAPYGDGKKPSRPKIGRLNTPSLEDMIINRPPTGALKDIQGVFDKPSTSYQSKSPQLPKTPAVGSIPKKPFISQLEIPPPKSRKAQIPNDSIIHTSDIIDSQFGIQLNPLDFVPNSLKNAKPLSESKLLETIQLEHKNICRIAISRFDNYKAIRKLWMKGERYEAIRALSELKDDATTVTLLKHLFKSHNNRYFTLDMCKHLLPLICGLLLERIHYYHEIALNATHLLYRSFSQFIKQSLSAPLSSLGVDLSAEDRIQKCKYCREYFIQILKIIKTKNFEAREDELGEIARNISVELDTFL